MTCLHPNSTQCTTHSLVIPRSLRPASCAKPVCPDSNTSSVFLVIVAGAVGSPHGELQPAIPGVSPACCMKGSTNEPELPLVRANCVGEPWPSRCCSRTLANLVASSESPTCWTTEVHQIKVSDLSMLKKLELSLMGKV